MPRWRKGEHVGTNELQVETKCVAGYVVKFHEKELQFIVAYVYGLEYVVDLVNDLHLDASVAQVATCVQGIQCFLQRVCMADKRLEIEDASCKTLQTGRPSVTISVDELQVDL